MTIIQCHECGKDLSDTATVCPACGTKTEFASRQDAATAKRKKLIFGVIGLCVALLVGRKIYIEKKNQEFIDSGAAAAMQENIRAIDEMTESMRRAQGK